MLAIGSGYSVEPSVVIPWTVNPRASKALAEAAEECLDVDLGRVAVQDVVEQPLEGAVIDMTGPNAAIQGR